MQRREFLKHSLQAAAGAAVAHAGASKPAMAEMNVQNFHSLALTKHLSSQWLTQNRAPLAPAQLLRLPIGSITPKGWVRRQLQIQLDGLNGRMPEVSDYLKYEGNGWVTPGANNGWEELPYWLRGFGNLGYVTGDERVIALARQWITGILAAQQPDGWFGPENLRTSLEGGPDMWPHMVVLECVRSYYEYTADSRALEFMTGYARFQATVPDAQFEKSWAGVRWGDNIESLHWLYNRTGDSSFLDLATKIHRNSAPWVRGIASWHNVNIAQGFREGAHYWQQSHRQEDRNSAYRNYDAVMSIYGQFPGGGFAGDENCRPGYTDPRQGFETCGIVEFMKSFESLARITGDPIWADRCEELAFNSLPAALDPLQKGVHYITSANSISLDNDAKGSDFDNDWPMQAYMPGIHNYRCCPHNYGMGWPYFAEEMWLATADLGVCASLYGPCDVRARVGGGGHFVHISEETHYPFGDTVRMTITADQPVEFPLMLRVPGWCADAGVQINGRHAGSGAPAGSFMAIERTWHSGDTIDLRLPMKVAVKRWRSNRNSVSIQRGPLAYSLAIDEAWKQTGGTDRWPEYEVKPQSAWNYGLVLDGKDAARSIRAEGNPAGDLDNPWTTRSAPVWLVATARKVDSWQADAHNVVGTLPESPVEAIGPDEEISLIPMGAARLRITSFPQISVSSPSHDPTP